MVVCFYFISSFGVCEAVIKISEAIRVEVHGVCFFGFGVFCVLVWGFFVCFVACGDFFLRSGREHGKSRY